MSIPVPFPQYYYVLYPGLILMQVGLVCSLFVIFRTFTAKRLTLSLRFPLAIALSDIILYVGNMYDQLYPLLTLHSRDQCSLAYGLVQFATLLNMLMLSCFAFLNRQAIAKKTNLEDLLGLNFLLLVPVAGLLSWFLSTAATPSRYWCVLKFQSPQAWVMNIIEFSLTVLSCWFIFECLWIVKIDTQHSNTKTKEKLEMTVIRKIFVYLLNYFIQWTLVGPHHLTMIFDLGDPDWIYAIANISPHIGPIFNFSAFLMNEYYIK